MKGYLRELVELSDRDECFHSYQFQKFDGSIIEDVTCDGCNPPINTRISIRITNDNVITGWDYSGPLGRRSETVKDIALVRVVEENEDMRDDYFPRIKEEARELENFLKLTNKGQWDRIKVTGYVVRNTTGFGRGLHFPFNNKSIVEQMEEQHPGAHQFHNYWHGRGGFRNDILGHAWLNAFTAWTYSGRIKTIKHEQGHNFSCPHSTTEQDEYGDPKCIMAKAHSGFSAPQMMNLEQLPEEARVAAEDCHFLVPVEVPTEDLREGESQVAVLNPENSRRIALSVRKPSRQSALGVDDRVDTEAIDVHLVNTVSSRAGTPVYEGSITPGSYKEFGDIKITNHGAVDGVVMFTVNDAPEKPYPKPLKPVEGDPFTEAHSGLWFNPEYGSQGLDLYVIPDEDRIVGYWYTFHAQGPHRLNLHHKHNGKEWFILDGKIDPETNTVDCNIKQVRGGEQKSVGWGVLRLDDGEIMFRSQTRNYGRDHWALQQLTTPREEPAGLYESGKFEGYSLGTYQAPDEEGNVKNIYVAYYFGHRGDNDLVWNVFQGRDANKLQGLDPVGSYKASRLPDPKEIDPVSISGIQKNKRVL